MIKKTYMNNNKYPKSNWNRPEYVYTAKSTTVQQYNTMQMTIPNLWQFMASERFFGRVASVENHILSKAQLPSASADIARIGEPHAHGAWVSSVGGLFVGVERFSG